MRPTPRVFHSLPQERIVYGEGAFSELRNEVLAQRARRAFIVTGTTLATKTPVVDAAVDQLGDLCAGVFHECREHVPMVTVHAAAARARDAEADLLISLGGGTPMDTAKAVALVLGEDAWSADRLKSFRIHYEHGSGSTAPTVRSERVLPHITVPTTISGGEYSHGFSVTDEATRAKDIFIHPSFVPRVVILDPAVTLHTPQQLWLSTGVRSVDHAIESFCSRSHTALTDSLALGALPRLFQSLAACRENPEDLWIRLECQIAAWLSIYLVIPNVRFGLSHALGHQVGARFGVPHGLTSCMLLPPVLAFNRAVNAERQSLLAEAIGATASHMNPDQGAAALAAAVERLVADLGLPSRLREFGVPRDQFAQVAQQALEDVIVETNPRAITGPIDVIGILEAAW